MLRFLHIPKTAGTSFKRYLQRAFSNEKFVEFSGHLDRDKWIYDSMSGGTYTPRLVGGHAALETGITSIDSMPTITLLREPVRRVKSYCQHVSEGKSPYLLEQFPPDSFDNKRFLESGNFEINNLQTAMLSHGWRFNEYSPYAGKDCDQAMDNLVNQLPIFGLVEYLPESIFLFHRTLSLPLEVLNYHNIGSRSNRLEFDEESLQTIDQLNQLDLELYTRAKTVFFERLEALPDADKDALRRFKLKWARKSVVAGPSFGQRLKLGIKRRISKIVG